MDKLIANPLILGALAVVLLLLVILVVWLTARSRRRNVARALGFNPEVFRPHNPVFLNVLTAISQARLAKQLKSLEGIGEALKVLKQAARKRNSRKSKISTALVETLGESDRRVDAAMLTVVRAICMDEVLYNSLPQSTVQEVDTLLDSLTDQPPQL